MERIWFGKNSIHRGTPRKISELTDKSRGDNNVDSKDTWFNRTTGARGWNVRKRKKRVITRRGQKVNTTVVFIEGRGISSGSTGWLCYACQKKLATLATNPIGNVQFGKKFATTQHPGGIHPSVCPAKRGIHQVTIIQPDPGMASGDGH